MGAALANAADELRKGEAERDELLRKERQAREAAEAADRSKDEFMAVLSHELRTPLNAVYGWARMLQSGELRDDATIARAKDAIVRNADAQVRLIDDLLDLSRITTGKMRLDVRRVDMPGVLSGALDAVRPAADAKGIRIRTTIDPDVGLVTGDPARLQQVVWNLLMNAVKFTPRGGDVNLQLQRVNAHVQIVISDTGQGIAPAMLPHVFERFRQADSSSTRAHGGLGLGLALVKHLVQLHGGTVVAHSDGDGRGATFTVTVPIAAADAAGRIGARAITWAFHRQRRRPNRSPGRAARAGRRRRRRSDRARGCGPEGRRRGGPHLPVGGRRSRDVSQLASRRPGLRHRDAWRGRLHADSEGSRARAT